MVLFTGIYFVSIKDKYYNHITNYQLDELYNAI